MKKLCVVPMLVTVLCMSLSLPVCARQITVSLAGDCSLGKLATHTYGGSFNDYFDRNGPEYFFQNVRAIFEADDMTLVNFEGVLTESNHLVPKTFNIKGHPGYISILPVSGIDAVTFGNNHRIDYGAQGIEDTLNAFSSIGLPYAFDEHVGFYTAKNGMKIGYVSINVLDGEGPAGIYVQTGINKLKEMGSDIILVCPHWGIEREHYPTPEQTAFGRACIDLGADLVVGCHPHVLQGFECYNGKYIIYSLGNFCFGANKNPKDKDSMIVQATFAEDDKTGERAFFMQVIPCMISSQSKCNDYCPTPAHGAARSRIIANLNRFSQPFGTAVSDEGIVTTR